MTLRDRINNQTPFMGNLRKTFFDIIDYNWIFETKFEKVLLIIFLLFGMYGIYCTIKGVF